MFAILAHIRPLDPLTNERVDVYVASTPSPAHQGLGGVFWESAITRRPRASLELFALDLSPGTRVAASEFEISLAAIRDVDARALNWKGAPVIIYRADTLQWPAPIEFEGTVVDPKRNLATDRLALSCQVSTAMMEKPLLTKEFNDTDLTFDPDKRTTLLPAGFGICKNIEPVFYDTTRYMFMLDGYDNLISISWLGEGLSSLGPSMQDYPTAAALVVAFDAGQVLPGRWATSIADGVGVLGAPPTGVITCHATFGYGMTGALMRRAILTHAEVAPERVEDSAFTALDASVPYPIHKWFEDQVQVKDLVEALAAGANASPVVTFQNKIAIVRPFDGESLGTFNRFGFNEPPVSGWETNDTVAPYWKIAARVARPERVLTFEEINYADSLIDRGIYDPVETYRQGNIVWLRNKSQWVYINELADDGHTPPDGTAGDTWWRQLAPAPGAADLRYDDDTPIEDLKPDEIGAQVTRAIDVDESALTVLVNDAGTVVAGQLPLSVRAKVTAASTDVSLTADWSIATSSSITATIDNGPSSPDRGTITVTALTAPGTITVMALSGGVYLERTVTVSTKGALADKTTAGTTDLKPNSVGVPYVVDGADITVGSSTGDIVSTPAAVAIGDAVDGGAIVMFTCAQDSGSQTDKMMSYQLLVTIDAGTEFLASEAKTGIDTSSGDTKHRMMASMIFAVTSGQTISVRVTGQSQQYNTGAAAGSFSIKDPKIVIFGAKR